MDLTRSVRRALKTALHTSWLLTINRARVRDDYAELLGPGPSPVLRGGPQMDKCSREFTSIY